MSSLSDISQQPGDPVRPGKAMVTPASEPESPPRFIADYNAFDAADAKLAAAQAELKPWRDISVSTDGRYQRTQPT